MHFSDKQPENEKTEFDLLVEKHYKEAERIIRKDYGQTDLSLRESVYLKKEVVLATRLYEDGQQRVLDAQSRGDLQELKLAYSSRISWVALEAVLAWFDHYLGIDVDLIPNTNKPIYNTPSRITSVRNDSYDAQGAYRDSQTEKFKDEPDDQLKAQRHIEDLIAHNEKHEVYFALPSDDKAVKRYIEILRKRRESQSHYSAFDFEDINEEG